MNNLILLVGESGSGKTTVATELERQYGFKSIQSYTTRPPRNESEYGHIFVSNDEFDALQSDLVAYTEYNGYRYGATKQQVNECDIYVIDPSGVQYFMEHYHADTTENQDIKPVKVVYLHTTIPVRVQRMEHRFLMDNGIASADGVIDKNQEYGKCDEIYKHFCDCIMPRVKNDVTEFKTFKTEKLYDYIIENDTNTNIQSVIDMCKDIILNTYDEKMPCV